MNTSDLFNSYIWHIEPSSSESSVERYRFQFSSFLKFRNIGDRDVSEITLTDINDWTAYCIKHLNLKGVTVSNYRGVVKRFLDWCEDHDHIKVSPITLRKLIKIVKVPPCRDEIPLEIHQKLLAFFDANPVKGFWKPACIIAWHTGLRVSDVAGLLWGEVNFENKTIVKMPLKTRRLAKQISVPIDDELFDLLANLKANPEKEWHRNNSLVLPEFDGYLKMDQPRICAEFSVFLSKVGSPPNITFHSYRHAFTSRLVNSGANPIVISSITGQSLETIQTYSHVSDRARLNAMAKAKTTFNEPE